MDKNAIKQRSISIETPFSAATLHRFLSGHRDEAGVKLDNPFKAPVVKVRKGGPSKMDGDGRQAWSFYLHYLHQRLVGTEAAEQAGAEIESLLKKEPLKLTVGMLLVPLQTLMAAEQARLHGANGLVKRWLANEKEVLQIALELPDDAKPREKVEQHKAALETACKVLARFSDCKDGEIDSGKIFDEAFEIGSKLSSDEVNALGVARLFLVNQATRLRPYLGPECASLVDLCISGYCKDKKEFRSDTQVKTVVSRVVDAMRARTDTDEYVIPASPRTVAERTPVRGSIPQFNAAGVARPEEPGRHASEKEKDTEKHETSTTPPKAAPPLTPRRAQAESSDINTANHMAPAQTPPPSPRGSSSPFLASSHPSGHGATVQELKEIKRPLLRKVITGPAELGSTTTAFSTSAPVLTSASEADASSNTTVENARPKPRASRHANASTPDDGSTTADITRDTGNSSKHISESKRKRLVAGSSTGTTRQKSDEDDLSKARTRRPMKIRSGHRSMPTPHNLDPDNPASVDAALDELKVIVATSKANRLQPRTDSEVFGKWEAAEKELQSVLTLEASHAMRRIMSFCHEVSLKRGEELASLQKVVMTAKPRSKEIDALVSVRDILLAESRKEAATKAGAIFPELLSLLIFTIDADRIRRADRAAHASS